MKAFEYFHEPVSKPAALSEEEKEGYRELYLQDKQCTHCGGFHLRACRRVREIVMRNREEIGGVKFWEDGKWDESGIIWPEDVFDESDTAGIAEALDKHLKESHDKDSAEEGHGAEEAG